MYFMIPEEFILSVQKRNDFDFICDKYRSISTDIIDEYNDEYAEADEEYFESVKG